MADFKALIQLISDAVDKFNAQVPGIQTSMLNDVMLLIKQLDTDGDTIKVSATNLKILSQVKSKLQDIILNDSYVKSVKDFVSNYDEVVKLQNNYFSAVEDKFKPPKLASAIKKEAINSVVNDLTENGLSANITDPVYDMLRQATTSGGSYSTLNNQLRDFLINNNSGEGQLLKYTKQITTDSLNQFSGQYTQLISSDLYFEWFRYSGTNIETSRPFCLACTDRKYFHISELPKVLRGEFEGFRKYNGKLNPKTHLPAGMIPGTDISNFMVNRGGYNCGHQWRPVSADLVPDDIKQRVYASEDYKTWAIASGKKIEQPAAAPVQQPLQINEPAPTKELNTVKKQLQDETGNDYTIEQTANGGFYAVHNDAQRKDLQTNKEIAALLADLGMKVKILEHVEEDGVKNPELEINGNIADNKIPDPDKYKSVVNPIYNAARSAVNQNATEVVIKLRSNYNYDDVVAGVASAFRQTEIKKIYLNFLSESIVTVDRKQYENGDYKDVIKSGYIEPK